MTVVSSFDQQEKQTKKRQLLDNGCCLQTNRKLHPDTDNRGAILYPKPIGDRKDLTFF